MRTATPNTWFIGKFCDNAIAIRDLKLENLILESDDIESNIKIIDFGTCKIFKRRERMRDIMGTVWARV